MNIKRGVEMKKESLSIVLSSVAVLLSGAALVLSMAGGGNSEERISSLECRLKNTRDEVDQDRLDKLDADIKFFGMIEDLQKKVGSDVTSK
jgi:hypothetical protein